MKPFVIMFSAAAILLAGAACGTARRSEPITGRAPAFTSELAEGRKVFIRQCHACHPGGEAGIGPALNNKPLPAALVKIQVRHGLGAMPALRQDRIDDRELDALVAYLVALRSVTVRPP